MPAKSSEVAAQQIPQHFEILDPEQLAERLTLPPSWVKDGTRSRASDPIPHLKLGKYVRFRWNSPELNAWIERRMKGKKQ
jgi:hypothetical protein